MICMYILSLQRFVGVFCVIQTGGESLYQLAQVLSKFQLSIDQVVTWYNHWSVIGEVSENDNGYRMFFFFFFEIF